MRTRIIQCAVISLIFFVEASARAQSIDGPLETAKQGLQRHHISLDRISLVRALQNQDVEVRWLAAEQLAETHQQDATPDILHALQIERIPRARINISTSLAELGDPQGVEGLRRECEDANNPEYLRIDAARLVLLFQAEGCQDAVLEGLRPTKDTEPSIILEALSLLPQLGHMPGATLKHARTLAYEALKNRMPAIRAASSTAISSIGDRSSIHFLREAISAEKDLQTRTIMQRNLDALQQRERISQHK